VQAPQLRPLGVGDVLDRTFTVYRSKPLMFIGLSAIWYLLLFLVFIVLGAVIFAGSLSAFARQSATPSPDLVAGAIVGIIGLGLIAIVIAILLFSAQSAGLVHAAARRYLAKEVTIGESFRAGLSAAGRLFVAGLLIFLAIAALWLLVFAVGGIVAAVSREPAIGVLAIVLAVIVAIVGSFYLAASWLVAPVVVVVEKMGPIAALSRSWRLSSGSRWRIIGIQVLLGILNLVLSLLIGGIFGGLAAAGQTTQPGQFGPSTVVQTLVNLASTIIWAPVEWIAFTILYYDLRVRKEAFDLQLAAEALPQS
jgi:hypothetical protein